MTELYSLLRRESSNPPSLRNTNLSLLDKTLVAVCAHNEAVSLRPLLAALRGLNVLVINDGSKDETSEIASSCGVVVINHTKRIGKPLSLGEAIEYTKHNGFDVMVTCDADIVTNSTSVMRLVSKLKCAEVGAAVAKQIPVGPRGLALNLDELIWAVFDHGRRIQMTKSRNCHLGGVMWAVKAREIGTMSLCINDDEQLGIQLRAKGLRTVYNGNAVAYFDASSSIGHIIERRKRMLLGHMIYRRSTAPSMQISVSAAAFARAIIESPRRLVWALPVLFVEMFSRLLAWRERRAIRQLREFAHWVTKYEKNRNLAIYLRRND